MQRNCACVRLSPFYATLLDRQDRDGEVIEVLMNTLGAEFPRPPSGSTSMCCGLEASVGTARGSIRSVRNEVLKL